MNRKAAESIDHYDGQVPAFIEKALERLYGARHASVEHFRVYQGLDAWLPAQVACARRWLQRTRALS